MIFSYAAKVIVCHTSVVSIVIQHGIMLVTAGCLDVTNHGIRTSAWSLCQLEYG